jgi:hypothetical protein
MNEMLDKSPDIRWDDIAGLSYAKQTLQVFMHVYTYICMYTYVYIYMYIYMIL